MKLKAPSQDTINLSVKTTSKHFKSFELPKINIHYWYPFNVNFTYRYTESKNFLYLVKEKGYTGPNLYKADILKRTRPLEKRNGIMFNPHVFSRNMYIMDKARSLGLPTIRESYTINDVQAGFERLGDCMQAVREQIENRFIWDNDEAWYVDNASEEWDEKVYTQATEEESNALIEFGEMYSMLTIMRKLVE
jgi:hypothetical protein